MRKRVTLLCLMALGQANAAVVGKMIRYQQGSTALEGYLAYDDSVTGKRPGIVIFHDWMGMGDFPKARAVELAHLGYVAFAADIYGVKDRPQDMKEAAAAAGKY